MNHHLYLSFMLIVTGCAADTSTDRSVGASESPEDANNTKADIDTSCGVSQPERGSAERVAINNALHMQIDPTVVELGKPLLKYFRLAVSDGFAFADATLCSMAATGTCVDWTVEQLQQTAAWAPQIENELFDGNRLMAVLWVENGSAEIIDWSFGATDDPRANWVENEAAPHEVIFGCDAEPPSNEEASTP